MKGTKTSITFRDLEKRGYKLSSIIDSGGFSDVFVGHCLKSQKAVAIKRLIARQEIVNEPCFQAELFSLRRLQSECCPFIVQFKEAIVFDRLAYFVLEFAPLGNLEKFYERNGPISLIIGITLIRQMLDALNFCHRLNIAHRDINPSNVLLASLYSARLADFGLAVYSPCASSGSRSLCREFLGRKSYMSPEVLSHVPYDPIQADLWSMGCLCYNILQMISLSQTPALCQNCFLRISTSWCRSGLHSSDNYDDYEIACSNVDCKYLFLSINKTVYCCVCRANVSNVLLHETSNTIGDVRKCKCITLCSAKVICIFLLRECTDKLNTTELRNCLHYFCLHDVSSELRQQSPEKRLSATDANELLVKLVSIS